MSAGRVLATQQAKDAAKKLLALTGPIKDQIGRVLQHGGVLADPNQWNGSLAGRWRSDWGSDAHHLRRTAVKFDQLGHAAQQVVEDIFKADAAPSGAAAGGGPPPGRESLTSPGSGANSDDGFTGGSLGVHQAAWCAVVGPVECGRAILLQRKAIERTNKLADELNWSTGQRNAFRHSYWMGLMTVHGFTYDLTTALGKAHENDTDTPGELPGSKDSNADLHNNATGARIGVDIRPWYVVLTGIGRTGDEEELEKRLISMLPRCTEDGSLVIVEK
ncbi:MAG: DUF6973 domain-containing protein [Pseudonocardiaceae bacterium]